jgi:hypothetical protein
MSFKAEVHDTTARNPDEWVSNGLRFATYDEANNYGYELLSRWYVPDKHRVVESDEPVNYRFDMDEYRAVPVSP